MPDENEFLLSVVVCEGGEPVVLRLSSSGAPLLPPAESEDFGRLTLENR